MLNHIRTQIISDLVRAPYGATEEMLRGIRGLVPGLLSELPTILSLYWTQEPTQISYSPLSRFGARETVTNQFCNPSQFIGPLLRLFDSGFSVSLFPFHHDLHSG